MTLIDARLPGWEHRVRAARRAGVPFAVIGART